MKTTKAAKKLAAVITELEQTIALPGTVSARPVTCRAIYCTP